MDAKLEASQDGSLENSLPPLRYTLSVGRKRDEKRK